MRTLVIALVMSLAFSTAAYAQRGGRGGADNAPKVGDDAPDFKAKKIGGKKKEKEEFVELKKLIKKEKKPVVLIFGSIT